ncbi:outer membrane lipoprotein LolB [Rheinheimera riviphila]|uniref:Outer-membrane lipoprotein LolB n=1 Tax=Rheinheimera riviphila TaxID=1834037 RepID=A0A437Q9M0_9GAMM|nr:outer membrane lipoprotein LolB [Rheinheimera riviphila]
MPFISKMFSKRMLSKCLSGLPKWQSVKKGSDVTQSTKRWLPVLVALFLSGCASWQQAQVAEIPLPAKERQQQLATLTQFELTASLGVKAPGDSVSGSLNWVQQDEFYTADLNNFIGINIFKLQTTAEGALVQVSGESHQAASAAALLDYLSGWSLPIEEMPLWLKGMTGASSSDLRFDPMGRLTSFSLLDSQNRRWQVSYPKFFPDRLSLPQLIILESSDTRLKLAIRQWKML